MRILMVGLAIMREIPIRNSLHVGLVTIGHTFVFPRSLLTDLHQTSYRLRYKGVQTPDKYH